MRHARDIDLDQLEALLLAIRQRPGLVERKRGVFYLRGQAFLHFHEHAGQLLADMRVTDGFARFNLAGDAGAALLLALDQRLKTQSGF